MARRAEMQRPPDERALRSLPAVSSLLAARALNALAARIGASLLTALLREHLAQLREEVRAGRVAGEALRRALRPGTIAAEIERAAGEVLEPRPRPLINATGVIVHTNLGRATLSAAAAQQVAVAARGYLDLEYDRLDGRRGERLSHLEPVMRRLFPGRGFTVVNNNAAAVLLCLRALARGKQVLVSRGELVEIGGSFRVPEILAASGARLVEVGTTNRTSVKDYERALGPKTGLILRVHPSNFKIVGFVQQTPLAALARVARGAGVPLVVDWGSGALVDLAPLGIGDEIPVARLLEEGADVVTFSGDKLLGGPQAGFVVGRPELVERIRRDPLARTVRLDRILLGAVRQTLVAYVRGRAFEEVPTLRMLAATAAEIDRRARRVRREVARRAPREARMLAIVDGVSRTGGGSSPTGERPTRLLAIAAAEGDAAAIGQRLRAGEPGIVGRMQEGRLLLDLRTVLPEQEPALVERLAAELRAAAPTRRER